MIALLLAAAVAAAPASDPAHPPSDPATRKSAVDKSVHEVLAGENYRFCHENDYPLYGDERGWCPLAGDPNANCPSLPRECKGDELAGGANPNHSPSNRGEPNGQPGEHREREQPRYLSLPNLG
ncbi:MAG TPA: hypothetical protein VFF06_15815, partial [Polyangia bacterium]|nr:hypothetical protein [Polyangia bacterium]